MKSIRRFGLLCFTLAVSGPNAYSTQVINQLPPTTSKAIVGSIVERGGTVDLLDLKAKTMTIDGRVYGCDVNSVVFHPSSSKDVQILRSIRPGSKIRFNTVWRQSLRVNQITEIWMSELGR